MNEMSYEDIVEICKQNVGTIIRIVDEDTEMVHFSSHRYPDLHSTMIRASIWKTDIPNMSEPRWQISASRGLSSMSGETSIVNEGNEHYSSYQEAVDRIEELAEEYDGEKFSWRNLPKKCYLSSGEEIIEPSFKENNDD